MTTVKHYVEHYFDTSLTFWKHTLTRMHSNRMRTARSSSRLWGGGGGICLSACWGLDPPGLGLETPSARPPTPPCVWAWVPPCPDPLPGVGLETPQTPNLPPGPGPWHPQPVNRILDTRFWKYYLAPTALLAATILWSRVLVTAKRLISVFLKLL